MIKGLETDEATGTLTDIMKDMFDFELSGDTADIFKEAVDENFAEYSSNLKRATS